MDIGAATNSAMRRENRNLMVNYPIEETLIRRQLAAISCGKGPSSRDGARRHEPSGGILPSGT